MTNESTPAVLGLSEGLGPNETLVERLRQERRPTAWTRGLDVDYPTAWEPNLLCHEAAAEIVRLRCLVEAVRGAFNRECDDTDEILRGQGLEPANCRTDGGSLKLQMVLGALEHRDVMRKRLIRRSAAQLDKWALWYGNADHAARGQLPLPPAGDVQLAEDIREALGPNSNSQTPPVR